MPWMPSGSEIDRGFKKLTSINDKDPAQGLLLRQSSEEYGYYIVDGVRQFRVSSKARQSGDIGRGRLLQLCKYLKLSKNDFKELCECRMTGPQYHQKMLKTLGLD